MKKSYLLICSLFAASCLFLTSCEDGTQDIVPIDNILAGAEVPDADCDIDHRTQTPGGWGSKAAGNNPGTLVDDYFDLVFPNDLHIGCLSGEGKCLYLTNAQAVEDFLPSGGKPAVLKDRELVDPTGKVVKNSLASHMVALTLSLEFDHYLDDFGASDYLLCDLVVCEGPFKGKTVSRVLKVANRIIGGCSTEFTIDEVYETISAINENFVDGTMDNGYLCCPTTKESI